MSVATQLGLDDPDTGLLAAAHHAWSRWIDQEVALGVVPELGDLPAWLVAHPGERNDVLSALSGLAAQQDGDDVAAAAALAWLLVPGRVPAREPAGHALPGRSTSWSPPSCGSRSAPSDRVGGGGSPRPSCATPARGCCATSASATTPSWRGSGAWSWHRPTWRGNRPPPAPGRLQRRGAGRAARAGPRAAGDHR